MKKQKAYGCQYLNLYLASIPSELKVIIGKDREQVSCKVEIIAETSINIMFSQTVHVVPRYKVLDLRQSIDEPITKAASNNKTEEEDEDISRENDNTEIQTKENDGDSNQLNKRKKGGRKPSS